MYRYSYFPFEDDVKHLESFQLVQEKEQPVPSLTVHFGTRVLAFAAGRSVVFREKCVELWFSVIAKYLAIPSAKVSRQLNSGPDSAYFFMLLICDIASVSVLAKDKGIIKTLRRGKSWGFRNDLY